MQREYRNTTIRPSHCKIKYKTEMFTYLLITVNTHIFVSLALQKRSNFRQEYGSIVLSDFVICCKLGHLSYLAKNVGAKGNLKKIISSALRELCKKCCNKHPIITFF